MIHRVLLALWLILFPMQGPTLPFGGPVQQSTSSAIATDGAGCNVANGSAGATATCTLSVSAGSMIVCSGVITGGFSLISISDPTNGNYSVLHQVFAGSRYNWEAYMQNSAAGSIAPVATANGASGFLRLVCNAFKNTRTTLILDTGAIGQEQTTTAANPTSGSTQTPANANEAIVCHVWLQAATPTAGTGFTLMPSVNSGAIFPEFQIQTTATAVNCPETATSTTWTDGQNGVLQSATGAPTNTPPTGAKFNERWTSGSTSCGITADSTCDHTWVNGAGTPASLVAPSFSWPLNLLGTKVVQITQTAVAWVASPSITTITAGTTFDVSFAINLVSGSFANGSDVLSGCQNQTSASLCAFTVQVTVNSGQLQLSAAGSTAATSVPIQLNTPVKVAVHVQSGAGNSSITVTTIGGAGVVNTFTANGDDTNFFVIGDTGDATTRTYQVGAIAVN